MRKNLIGNFRIPDCGSPCRNPHAYWEISDSGSGITSLAEIHFLTPIPVPLDPDREGRASGGKGRHGGRRGGAKRDARGLKTRERPQMMVMMARVAFRALKTKNGAAIAVRDGGHDIGRTDPTWRASSRASTASGSHRRRTWTSTRPW